MTSLSRSANDWTNNELSAYKIEVHPADTPTFFNVEELPEASVSQTILNNLHQPEGQLSKTDSKFFQLLGDVEYPLSEESAVGDFAVSLLSLLDYDHDDRRLHTKKEMSFRMCGQRVDAEADVVLMNGERYLLHVEGKPFRSGDDQEAQFIAKTIAAAEMNNSLRLENDLAPLDTQIIPGIIMVGTELIFYHVVVTTALLKALSSASEPADSTIVLKYTPPVPNPATYATEGMRPLENRRIVFQCLEAFKALIVSHLQLRDSDIGSHFLTEWLNLLDLSFYTSSHLWL